MKKLKQITVISLAAIMAASLAACGGSGSGSTTAAETKAESQADAGTRAEEAGETKESTGEKVKLTCSVWDNAASPQFEAVAKAFMEKNPDVEIEMIDTQSSEYGQKLTVMLSSGDSDPDVIFVKDTETQVTMKNKNQLLSLDEYIKKDNLDLSGYGDIIDQLKMDGSQYTLPFRKDYGVRRGKDGGPQLEAV